MLYPVENGYVISSGGSWLPGVYEDAKAARYAYQFSNADLQSITEKICVIGKREITTTDLREHRKINDNC